MSGGVSIESMCNWDFGIGGGGGVWRFGWR